MEAFVSVLLGDMTRTRSPQTTGEEPDQEGSGVFQTMFLSVDQVVGRFFESLELSPLGPRHWGQLSLAERLRVARSRIRPAYFICDGDGVGMGFVTAKTGQSSPEGPH